MKKVISSSNAPKAVGPYSQAIETNQTLYLSGQLPINPATGKFISDDVKEQTRQSFDNINAILIEAGYSFQNIVKCTVLLKDIADFAAMNEVYAAYFAEQKVMDMPARVAYQVANLPMDARVEIEAIAVKG